MDTVAVEVLLVKADILCCTFKGNNKVQTHENGSSKLLKLLTRGTISMYTLSPAGRDRSLTGLSQEQ